MTEAFFTFIIVIIFVNLHLFLFIFVKLCAFHTCNLQNSTLKNRRILTLGRPTIPEHLGRLSRPSTAFSRFLFISIFLTSWPTSPLPLEGNGSIHSALLVGDIAPLVGFKFQVSGFSFQVSGFRFQVLGIKVMVLINNQFSFVEATIAIFPYRSTVGSVFSILRHFIPQHFVHKVLFPIALLAHHTPTQVMCW